MTTHGLAAGVLERGAELDGVAAGEGAFTPGPALWVGAREVAHIDADGALDLRLTRRVLSQRRAALRADGRVRLRPSGSDWCEVVVATPDDVAFALELVAAAVAANLATAPPGPPPSGAALERRRRFH